MRCQSVLVVKEGSYGYPCTHCQVPWPDQGNAKKCRRNNKVSGQNTPFTYSVIGIPDKIGQEDPEINKWFHYNAISVTESETGKLCCSSWPWWTKRWRCVRFCATNSKGNSYRTGTVPPPIYFVPQPIIGISKGISDDTMVIYLILMPKNTKSHYWAKHYLVTSTQ
jgi:hypothetical protein